MGRVRAVSPSSFEVMRDRSDPVEEQPLRLDPRLGNTLFDVWLVSRAVNSLIDDAIRSSGLDADEFAIYSVLASSDHVTPSELAHWMAAPATTVSSYIKRFEARGHVERVTNPDDGRSRRIKLTASGRRAHRRAGVLFIPILHEVEQRLGRRTEQTHQRLQGLHQIVDEIRHPT